MSDQEVTVTLQPWDHYPRPFNIYVDHSSNLVKGTFSEGSWKLPEGKHLIDVVWGGWFNPSGAQIDGDHYSFWTDQCENGGIEIGYRKIDPAKPASVVVTCEVAVAPTTTVQPPPTSTPTTTAPPQVTSPTAPPSTVSGQPTTTVTHGTPTPTAQCTEFNIPVNDSRAVGFVDGDGDGFVCDQQNGNAPCVVNCGIAVKASADELPFTGSNDVPIALTGGGLLIAGTLFLALARKMFKPGLDRVS